MTIIRINKEPPVCPLCEKRMTEVFTPKGVFYVCVREFCMISIRKDDPCAGKWLEKWPENAPKCPLCQRPMRWFYRVDGFMKCQCRNTDHRLIQIARGHADELSPL
jgi:hypothetical protein